MESKSYHSRLANQVNTSITQKPFNHHTQFNGIKQNGFQGVQSPASNVVNQVSIKTKFK